jgi:hypothetical protein
MVCSGYAISPHVARSGDVAACAPHYPYNKFRGLTTLGTSPDTKENIAMRSHRSSVVSAALSHVVALAVAHTAGAIAGHAPTSAIPELNSVTSKTVALPRIPH